MYKFRTITPNTQESEKEKLTRTGNFLRRFRLDEIPQIINVVKGELSFVGPRPLWVGEYTILNEHIPHHHIRSIATLPVGRNLILRRRQIIKRKTAKRKLTKKPLLMPLLPVFPTTCGTSKTTLSCWTLIL